MDFIQVAMEEYKTLRQEINTAMSNQQSILNYGIASMSVIIAFSSSNWQEKLVIDLILILLVPVICIAITTIWLGEVNRIARAGNFLVEKEREINRIMKDDSNNQQPMDALMWENYLRNIKGNSSFKAIKTLWNYRAILVLLSTFGLGAISIGIYHNFVISQRDFSYLFYGVALLFIGVMIYSFQLLTRIKTNNTYVVVDGGGSTTRIYINRLSGQTTIEINQGLHYKKNNQIDQTFQDIFSKIDAVISLNKVKRFTFGVAGLDARSDKKIYHRYLSRYLPKRRYKLMNDGLLIVKALNKNERNYLLVLCGTGSNVLTSKRLRYVTNHDLKCDSKAGATDLVSYFINHYEEHINLPKELKDKVEQYKQKAYKTNDLKVIKDFTDMARMIVSNMDNDYCLKACEQSINTLLNCIQKHDKLLKRHYKIYVFGGLFKSDDYYKLFDEMINRSHLKCYNVIKLNHDFVRRNT